jgi:hypothetical protein
MLREFHINFPKGTTYVLREGVFPRLGQLRTYWPRRKEQVLSSHEVPYQKTPRFFMSCVKESRYVTWIHEETLL